MKVQSDQGVGSQTVEQSRVSEGTSGARKKGVVGRPRQQGKVYAMTQQEAEDAPDVITGTILICNLPADVLFDPGATQSFVSSIFLTKLNRMLSLYLRVEGIDLLVDLLPLELQRKEVVFRKPGFAEVVFRGMRKVVSRSLISVLKAEKLLRKGCTAFLAHIVVVQKSRQIQVQKSVVRRFHAIFQSKVAGSPGGGVTLYRRNIILFASNYNKHYNKHKYIPHVQAITWEPRTSLHQIELPHTHIGNTIEAAAGGALEDKTPTVARDLIFFMVEHFKSSESRPTELDN
ncbi:Retroviral aspartyl protease [Cucumis melo var. makuwa]|uniref:Retroviral aspartyl protease n=1 Tax=Cucumis melo var. makuwa TaxID=1194695 RepID=A0A5A7V187_CUCMM|nr:Retroviral aspartyl protease [Cucumis melo var. makuwa]TYK14122.1 Retroviral aspartyl protease [Cucumis melo var. makuwa]